MPAEFGLDGLIRHFAGLHAKGRVGEGLDHRVMREITEIAAVLGRAGVLRFFARELGEIGAALDLLDQVVRFRFGADQDMARAHFILRFVFGGELVVALLDLGFGELGLDAAVDIHFRHDLLLGILHLFLHLGIVLQMLGIALGCYQARRDHALQHLRIKHLRRNLLGLRAEQLHFAEHVGTVDLGAIDARDHGIGTHRGGGTCRCGRSRRCGGCGGIGGENGGREKEGECKNRSEP